MVVTLNILRIKRASIFHMPYTEKFGGFVSRIIIILLAFPLKGPAKVI
jgi:hypothetical protein